MEKLTCPCCHGAQKLETRFDVKGRPYLTCASCAVRIFPRGVSSIVGLALLSPLADALSARIRSDREEWQRAQETTRRVEAAMTRTPPATGTAATLAESAPLAVGGVS